MTVSLQVSWRPLSCHQVIFPFAPVNSVRTEKPRQAWEKAQRKKRTKRSSVNHRKIAFGVFTCWHLESRCVSLSSWWVMEMRSLYRTLQKLHLHYCIHHYIIHPCISLIDVGMLRSFLFIWFNNSMESTQSILESFHWFGALKKNHKWNF